MLMVQRNREKLNCVLVPNLGLVWCHELFSLTLKSNIEMYEYPIPQ